MLPIPAAVVLRLAALLLSETVLDRLTVLALWRRARATPGVLDDAAVGLIAAALGVTLPEVPAASGDAPSGLGGLDPAPARLDEDGALPAPRPGERIG